jgi:transposase
MKPIPTEMRKRILDDCDNGMTEHQAAAKWKVGRSTIAKIKKQRRDTGCIEPLKGTPGPKAKLREHRGLLQQIVAQTPDATLEEIREQLPVAVSIQTVHVELKKLKLVYKKKRFTPPNKSDLMSPKNVKNGSCK